uniref:Neuropeptide-Like Protein n=1 Tax=Steinernema glaseri TaxID=37863 RepID=A0A1I7YAZ0_9BILA
MRFLIVFTVLAALTAAAPIYWYDMEKQLLYSFEDPDFFRFNTFVSDYKDQPIIDITRAKKSQSAYTSADQLRNYLRNINLRV